ncbi:AEC family transporter [Burkholderia anthina]|uniref:AEC family transporter n=1 Tax=Burkholderia anthina TaxID=179879 RepID=UPI0007572E2A|nr:AEC family transporter [Burkholderia anthina]KVN53120.1 transporter [Burkholderia anthina]
MLHHILDPIVPVAIVIAIGFWTGKRRTLKHEDSLLLSRFVLTWIFPALLLTGMASTPREQLLDYRFVIATLVGIMGMYAIAFAIGWIRFRTLAPSTLKAFLCGFPDAAFMGIPILEALFGPKSLYSVLVLNIVASLIMVPITTTLLTIAKRSGSGVEAFRGSVTVALKKPLMWAPALGILVSLLGLRLPSTVSSALGLLGKATPGVSLFCLGLIMSSVSIKLSREVWTNIGLKLLLHPLMMLGAMLAFAVNGPAAQQMVLLSALPSATIPAMFANEAGAYQSEAATSILISTVLSIATFAAAIALTDSIWA